MCSTKDPKILGRTGPTAKAGSSRTFAATMRSSLTVGDRAAPLCSNGYPVASGLKITTVTETCPEAARGHHARPRWALACSTTGAQRGHSPGPNGRRHGLAARLRDVAERAGVSVKTVSNVVNH